MATIHGVSSSDSIIICTEIQFRLTLCIIHITITSNNTWIKYRYFI